MFTDFFYTYPQFQKSHKTTPAPGLDPETSGVGGGRSTTELYPLSILINYLISLFYVIVSQYVLIIILIHDLIYLNTLYKI